MNQFRKGQKVMHLIAPNVEAAMTGVWRVMRAHDLTVLEYTDGTREAAMIPLKKWREISGNHFSIVGTVQAIARAEHNEGAK